jgi:hypothetical protein
VWQDFRQESSRPLGSRLLKESGSGRVLYDFASVHKYGAICYLLGESHLVVTTTIVVPSCARAYVQVSGIEGAKLLDRDGLVIVLTFLGGVSPRATPPSWTFASCQAVSGVHTPCWPMV